MAKDDKSPKVRITNQFHDNQGMVYDLKCDTTRITISLGATRRRLSFFIMVLCHSRMAYV